MNDIRFFLPSDTDFTSQGENILPLTKCLETKVDNQDWYVEVECPLTFMDLGVEVNATSWIYQGAIIVVPTNGYGDQPFKINNPSIEDDLISFRARHIGYSSENYMLADVYPQNQTAQGSIEWIIARTVPASPFTAYSDYLGVTSSRYVRTSLLAALNGLQDLYGGHLDFDKFQIRLSSVVGSDKQESIDYGVNLEGATVTEDWSSVVTTLLPVGKDGLTLTETFLYADVTYDDPFVKTHTFEEAETEEALRAAGQAYLDDNKLPKINYEIRSNLVNGIIGDTVKVKAKSFTLLTTIMSYTSDRLTNEMVSVEFGNFRRDARSVFSNIQAALKDLGFKNEDVVTMVSAQTDIINNLFQFGHAVHTADATYYVDRLPKEDAQQVMMLSMAGIGFSSTGINGPFYSAWTLDSRFNAENISGQTINVANANVAGVLTVGVHRIEKYDANTTMIRMI